MRTLPMIAALVAFSGVAVAQERFDPPFDSSRRPVALPDPTKLPSSAPAPANPYIKVPVDLAFGAYQRGLYVTAMQEAMKRLETNGNDAAAMALVAELYRDGLAVKQSQEEANRWYRLAADRGDAQAQFALGLAYLEGRGVKADPQEARALFEKAAAKNQSEALYNLAVMSMQGQIQDFRKAADLFRRSMEAGNIEAIYALSMLYKDGSGVPQDRAMATQLLHRAADEKLVPAMVDYAIALFNGTGTEKNEEEAAKYFIKAASLNNPVAQNRLARLYVVGRGVKPDLVEAMKWHVLARANGLPDDWLEEKLRTLSQGQKTAVEEAIQRFLGK